ncbi:MAG: type II secretion system protein [Candidatus Gastranaerophilaceae bacterium]
MKKMNLSDKKSWSRIKRYAFTLSEVLITLTIIGVIAALTISALVNKVNETKNVAALKKIYTVLNQVTMFVVLDKSSPNYWGLDEYSPELAYSYYKPYFKVVRECSNQTGCWKYPTKFLSGKVYMRRAQFYQYMFTLVDGMNILMNIYPKEVIASEFGVNVAKDSVVFVVDVNGDSPPNQIGRDIFAFVLNGKEIVPSGRDNSYNCNRAASGLTCTARIISDGWKVTYY